MTFNVDGRKGVRAVFLDRDDTINVDFGFTHKVSQLQLLDGAAHFLKKLHTDGYLLFVVTNQSGIGRGLYHMEDVEKFHQALNRQVGFAIQEFAVCPHRPEDNCPCRKPHPTLINALIEKYRLERAHSFMIGDRESDLEAGRRAGLTSLDLAMGYTRLYEEISRSKNYKHEKE